MELPLYRQSATICVDSYQIKKWYHFNDQKKGSNILSILSIRKGYYFSPDPDADVSVVYAVPKGNDKKGAPFVLMHFHKSSLGNSLEWRRRR